MPWIPRGLSEGIVTTRYPRKPDSYGEGFRGSVVIDPAQRRDRDLESITQACPTAAISYSLGAARLDRGACILCGRCTELDPEVFRFSQSFETSVVARSQLVVPEVDEDDGALAEVRAELARRTKALRRSVHIRHVDAGSDGAEEWEIAALTNPIYDVQRLGIFFTASPKHADLLLVTGAGSAGMMGPLRQTFEIMPNPKIVIAAGVDAISGGLIGEGYATHGGVAAAVPVDVFVPGSPPSPFGLLHGIMLAVGLLSRRCSKSRIGDEEASTGRSPSEDQPRGTGR